MLRDTILDWYVFMSSLSVQLTTDVLLLDQRVGIPLISALLLGFIGAAAPCQLTQSVGMVAVLGQTTAGRPRWRATFAYLAGKALVYTSLGVLAVVVGASLSELSIPVFVAARKVLGPLMIVVGLGMIGALRFTWVPGHPVALRLRQTLRHRAQGAPFLLGVAFGFAFCPTLFALFFGFLIPLALSRPDGVLYPALFALGTALPLLTILGLLTFAGGSLRRYARQIGRGQQVVAVLAGALLVIAGLHDTVLYWLI
jgi:cytochrome c biogenesis protein CcdA